MQYKMASIHFLKWQTTGNHKLDLISGCHMWRRNCCL